MIPQTNLLQQWYLKWLWLKHSYAFRWAHKPLCDRFHDDSLHIGKLHICRGCTLLYSGMILSFILYLFSRNELIPMILPLSIFVLPLSYPTFYQPLHRLVKDALRFGLGSLMTFMLLLLITGQWMIGAGLLVISYVYCKHINQVRAKMKANACMGCSEYGGNHVCSGYQMQAECLRRYDEEGSVLLMKQYNPHS